jgi:mRNA interferase MazF
VKRGEVYLTTLPSSNGSEQCGTRPVIIVSNDKFNQDARWHSILVVCVTKSQNQSNRASVAFIPKGVANLRKDSWALCHQVFVIDKNKLTTLIGELPANYLRDVERGLKVALYLP